MLLKIKVAVLPVVPPPPTRRNNTRCQNRSRALTSNSLDKLSRTTSKPKSLSSSYKRESEKLSSKDLRRWAVSRQTHKLCSSRGWLWKWRWQIRIRHSTKLPRWLNKTSMEMRACYPIIATWSCRTRGRTRPNLLKDHLAR